MYQLILQGGGLNAKSHKIHKANNTNNTLPLIPLRMPKEMCAYKAIYLNVYYIYMHLHIRDRLFPYLKNNWKHD